MPVTSYEKVRGKRRIYWDCGVPLASCLASLVAHSGPPHRDYKAHGSFEEALRCAKKYAQIRNQEGGEIFLPSKPLIMKTGKGNRAMVPSIR